jgi:hypothetical protein
MNEKPPSREEVDDALLEDEPSKFAPHSLTFKAIHEGMSAEEAQIEYEKIRTAELSAIEWLMVSYGLQGIVITEDQARAELARYEEEARIRGPLTAQEAAEIYKNSLLPRTPDPRCEAAGPHRQHASDPLGVRGMMDHGGESEEAGQPHEGEPDVM